MSLFYLNAFGRTALVICHFVVFNFLFFSLQAQCNSVSTAVVIPPNATPIEIDANLDGIVDFSFTNVAIPDFQSVTITGLNGHQVLTTTTNGGIIGAAHVVFGASICANENYITSTTLYNASQGIGLVFAGSGGAYIGISNGANIGFMNIQISIVPGGDVTITYSDYGVGLGMGLGDCNGISAVAGDCSSLLPVKLRSFEGYLTNYGIHLKWVTENGYQNAGFHLERSLDNKIFERIHWIERQGTQLHATEYVFEDLRLPVADTYYYRLLQVDELGHTVYSETVVVDANSTRTKVGVIYPNPSALNTWIELDVEYVTDAILSLYNTTGVRLQHFTKKLQAGKNNIALNLPSQAANTLILKIELNNKVFYRSIIAGQ